MKKIKTEVKSGFIWEDPEGKHIIACGDVCDVKFLTKLLKLKNGIDSFHLTLADPPYVISSKQRINLKGRKDMFLNEEWDCLTEEAMEDLIERFCSAAFKVTHSGNIWVWTSDWWLSNIKRTLRNLSLRVWPTYVWCKSNPAFQIRKSNLASACEFLAMSSASGNYFNLDSLPRQRNWFVAHSDGEFTPAISPSWVERPVVHAAERLRRDGTKGEFLNRAQKPLDVTEALIRSGCPINGLVFDCFGGTGTTLVASDRANRNCIYVDLDPKQVRAAAQRLIKDRKRRE